MQRDQITARLTETLSRSPRATSVSVPVEWIRVLIGASEAPENKEHAPWGTPPADPVNVRADDPPKPKRTRRKTAKPAE
ncbi:hypothetical protein [Allorhodopirellula heiligendammensis]|uniref:Uncharacterized protein n=1 Tax=Allorhodopirellula heiligendammensis TaxID=2714739 RepID=A0A5C6C5B1_9BACT|nr:hypothetical protein [Allorhodopirellula heiligendammensis]TWU17989.1 hypothetical protein Poly21_01420 [Allorhodopirellula heiligendammensis]